MAKEKTAHYEKEERDLTFYYEIVGILCIIITILGFARLGTIGFYIMLIFKIIFGDWYFLFLFSILCYGLRCLIYHRPMDLKRMRFIGIVLILLGIMILSHFPMHRYLISFDTNGEGGYYGKTIALYLDYFKNYYDGMVVGGGIIGASFFYIFYSLLSAIGTSFIIVIFIIVGVVFFTEKTIKEFVDIVLKKIKLIYNFFKKKFKSFKYEIKVPTKTKKRIKYEDLAETVGIKYESLEHQKAIEYKEKLSIILNKMNVFFGEIVVTVSYNVTTLLIDSIAYIDLQVLNGKIKQMTDNDFLIKKDIKTKKTIIEINNIYESIVQIKTMLDMQNEYRNNFIIPIGINSVKNIKMINTSAEATMLIEDSNSYSTGFIQAIITMYYLKNKLKDFKIISFSDFSGISKIKKEFNINNLVELANTTLNKINDAECLNIDDYNQKNVKEKLRHYLLIFTDNELLDVDITDKVSFLLQVACKVGFQIIFITKDKKSLPVVYENYFDYMMYFKNAKSLEVSKHLSLYECFLVKKGEIERITPVYLKEEEFDKFKEGY